MQGTKQKKFTHNRMKACIDRSDHANKENIVFHDDFRNKKMSVELPSKCIDFDNHQKSIFNEQISVTLNTSNPRPNTMDRDLITLDVKTLSHLLSRQHQNMSLREILLQSELKSFEVKLLADRLAGCLKNQQKFICSIMEQKEYGDNQQQLNSTLMKPYIEKEIEVLSKNLQRLRQQKEAYLSIGTLGNQNKNSILNSLRELHSKQIEQLSSP